MNTIFSIDNKHIDDIPPDDCVGLFRDLLHCDARKLKLSISKVHITTKTIRDGGIDASFEGEITQEGDLIIDSKCFYQIKSGETFRPQNKSTIKKELLSGKPKRENLGKEVNRCFESNGTYILVCMKVQLSTEHHKKAEENLIEVLNSCGINNPKVKVIDQSNILGVIKSLPSLILRLTGYDSIFQSHDEWSNNLEMNNELRLGEKQKKSIKMIQNALFGNSKAIHVNVYGEPGVGKTRLVLESTRCPSLSPLVIYCTSPKELDSSPLLSDIVRDNNLHCILVIDKCNYDDRSKIWNRLALLGPRIKLVTISQKYGGSDEPTRIEVPKLDDTQIKEIIKKYHNDGIVAGNLSRICGGIPHFAHVIGGRLKNNSGDMLRISQDTSPYFDRYVNQDQDPNSIRVQQRKKILFTISLFKKFGNSTPFSKEFNAVHKIIEQIDPSITLPLFQEHITELRQKKILQGQETLYIDPKILHIWLWTNWWECYYPAHFTFENLVDTLPPKLRERFMVMFQYAGNLDSSRNIVQKLFKNTLSNPKSTQASLGADLFHILSAIDPVTAIDYFKQIIEKWPNDDFKNFSIGRNSVIYGLERIVFESDLFEQGGYILRNLAENERESSNATGLFTGLFSLGPGYVSFTKTPPKERLPLLKDTLCSENKNRRNLGLKACESALVAMHFLRHSVLIGDELRIKQKGWEPKTYSEWADEYKSIIELMVEKLQTFPNEDKKKCALIISQSSRGLIHAFPFMANYVAEKLFQIKEFVDKENMLQNINEILEFEKEALPSEIKSKFEKLQIQIIGQDYSSRLKRYAGMDIMVDLAKKDRETWRLKHIQKLVEMSLDAEKLKPELAWLTTDDAKYGHVFGQELAKKDKGFSLLPLLLDEQRKTGKKGSGFFLSGYLQVIFEKDNEKWLQIMKEISKDSRLTRFLIETAYMSGLTDAIGLLILDLVKSQKIKVNELKRFVFGGVVNGLSETVMVKWIEYMVGTNDQKTIFSALSLYYSFFVHRGGKTLNPELVLKLLTHSTFMGKESTQAYDTMTDYYWKETGLRLIKQHPGESLEFADKILANMGSASIISLHSQSLEVLDAIASMSPDEVWALMAQYISPSSDERGLTIIMWMRNGVSTSNSFTNKINFQKILDWIDHDPHKLAPYIIRYVPPILDSDSLARKLLVKYGNEKSVQQALAKNFTIEGFSGSVLIHLQKKKKWLLDYKKQDDNKNVKNWIDFYVRQLDADIDDEKSSEEGKF